MTQVGQCIIMLCASQQLLQGGSWYTCQPHNLQQGTCRILHTLCSCIAVSLQPMHQRRGSMAVGLGTCCDVQVVACKAGCPVEGGQELGTSGAKKVIMNASPSHKMVSSLFHRARRAIY